MSVSEITFPFLILLVNILLKFEGFIIADSFFICVNSNSLEIILIFFIFGFELVKDKKSI